MASVHVRKAAPGDPRAARKAPRRGAAAKAASGRKAPGKPTARKAPGKQPGRRRAATRAPFRSYTIEVTQVRKWTIGVPGSEARSMAEAIRDRRDARARPEAERGLRPYRHRRLRAHRGEVAARARRRVGSRGDPMNPVTGALVTGLAEKIATALGDLGKLRHANECVRERLAALRALAEVKRGS